MVVTIGQRSCGEAKQAGTVPRPLGGPIIKGKNPYDSLFLPGVGLARDTRYPIGFEMKANRPQAPGL